CWSREHDGGTGRLRRRLVGAQASAAATVERVGQVGHVVVGDRGARVAHVDLDAVGAGRVAGGVPAEGAARAVVLLDGPDPVLADPEAVVGGGAGGGRGGEHRRRARRRRTGWIAAERSPAAAGRRQDVRDVGDLLICGRRVLVPYVNLEPIRAAGGQAGGVPAEGVRGAVVLDHRPDPVLAGPEAVGRRAGA